MTRFKTFSFLLVVLLLGLGFVFSSRAAAQSTEPVNVIDLSASGFEQVRSVAFSSDGKFLAAGGTSGIYLIDPRQLSTLQFIRTNTWARSVSFVPGSETLAAGLFNNSIKFWSLPEAQLTKTLSDLRGWVRSISISVDGSLIASASDDNAIRVWRMDERSPFLVLTKDTTGVRAVALSPNGLLVAGALGDKTVRVWAVPSGELLYTFSGHEDWVRCLAFSPNGQRLASGSFDKTIRIWNTASGELERTLKGHSSSVLGVAFSPDGKTLASGSVDQTVRLWNVDDGAPLRVLQGHTNFVYSVSFSPDGQTLASGSGDNTVRLWDMNILGKADPNTELPSVTTPSDCRACHHRRGLVEAAPVIELDCENCHAGGISLSWCGGIARSRDVEKTPIAYQAVDVVSGVPINDRDLGVMIASPGNGETLYVKGDAMAPENISGQIFSVNAVTFSDVEVRLDIISNGKTTATLHTQPESNGNFNFNVAINLGSAPPYFARPGTRACLACHGDFVAQANLPKGDVHVVVTATTPDDQKAVDDRWIHVDTSGQLTLPVQVLDAETGDPLAGLSLDARAILYQWRSSYATAASDVNGEIQLNLGTLSQHATTYELSIQPQILNGILYSSSEPIQVQLEPGANSHGTVTLPAQAMPGHILGKLDGTDPLRSWTDATVWAIQMPAGPAYQTRVTSGNAFAFDPIPVSQYLVVPDMAALSEEGLSTSSQSVDLQANPLINVSVPIRKDSIISGKVTTKDGTYLPFAWVTVGRDPEARAIDPASGSFDLPGFPSDATFVTVTAPGYYSLPLSIRSATQTVNGQLVTRPETRFLPWGDGQVVLPPETLGSVNGLQFSLEHGWLWGWNSNPQSLEIHVPGIEIQVQSGTFAFESPASGTGWLYVTEGLAEVRYDGSPDKIQVRSGQMIANIPGARPVPMQPVVFFAFHPAIHQTPVFEIVEPSLQARIQTWLVKTGIGAMQTITFITYILSLVTLIAIPLAVLFSTRKKRHEASDSQETH
jgi:WD40 repeat protein